jgi:phosphohistidine phosphatase
MKTLVLIRHSKSDWSGQGLSDFERPLNDRGINDAPLMAKEIKALGIYPDLIISSPAVRAFTTASMFAAEFNYDESRIITQSDLYHGGIREYVNVIHSVPKTVNTLLIFGHNPNISLTAGHFIPAFFEQLPTTGVVCIDFDIDEWVDIESVSGNLRLLTYPKLIR